MKLLIDIQSPLWHDFISDPPYNAEPDIALGYETDHVFAWFIYRYENRNKEMLFLSHAPCRYSNGVFEGYESHMKTSPYPEDRIQILYYCLSDDARDIIQQSFEKTIGTCGRRLSLY